MNLELEKDEIKIIQSYLNEDGKLTCAKGLALAKKLKVDSFKMLDICDQMNIKITDCELGLFGNKEIGEKDENLYEKIVSYSSSETKVSCTKLWEEAKISNMKNIRSSIKDTDIFVTYCQLGCFKEDRKHGSKI